jgi:hypothetical protein
VATPTLEVAPIVACPPPAALLPKWVVELMLALRGVGCRIDEELPKWALAKVPESEAQKVVDWLKDAKARGKKYSSPRMFLNNWLKRVKNDEQQQRTEGRHDAADQPVRGHFPGGRELAEPDAEKSRRAMERLRAGREAATGVL